jgi:hypothetical protein
MALARPLTRGAVWRLKMAAAAWLSADRKFDVAKRELDQSIFTSDEQGFSYAE